MKILTRIRFEKRLLTLVVVTMLAIAPSGKVAAQPGMVGMGDSIGEGVQAGDAAWQTQVFSYLNWVSFQMGGDLTIPFIQTNPLGVVGDTQSRFRLLPETINTNTAVSGADVFTLLNERPDATTTAQIDSEAELVLYPRLLSQMEYVESVSAEMILCWIGNNDVLSAVISFANLDASQMTPVADFEARYIELADRMGALIQRDGSKVVFANIPSVTDIGFLVDRNLAQQITGFPVGLPDGHFTSIFAVFIMAFLGNDLIVYDPNFVLDPGELAQIQDRVEAFNEIIEREAGRIGMPVVDINSRFAELTRNPPVILGRQLSRAYLGGLFSLDGIHPTNFGHALVANEFIREINQAFAMDVPELTPEQLTLVFLSEPAFDKDLDGRITGRPGVGLLETLALQLGISGDPNDFVPN